MKTLGQINFEAWEPGGVWDEQDESLQEDFEYSAQAVTSGIRFRAMLVPSRHGSATAFCSGNCSRDSREATMATSSPSIQNAPAN